MGAIFTQEAKSESARVAIVGTSRIYTPNDIENYVTSTTSKYREEKKWIISYPELKYLDYKIFPVYIGTQDQNVQIQKIIYFFVESDHKIIKFLILFGVIASLFVYIFKNTLLINLEWLIMGFVCILYIILIIFVPFLSINYNLERLYQQTLVLLSVFLVISINIILHKYSRLTTNLIVCFLVLVYYFSYNGIILQVFGGSVPINLNNFGLDYEKYYIYKSEIESAKWLSANKLNNSLVYADRQVKLRLSSSTDIELVLNDVIPSVIDINSYVYASRSNFILGRTWGDYNNSQIIFNFPKRFLSENKNVVYSSGSSVIYK
jgi:uncharacterized membrane protein